MASSEAGFFRRNTRLLFSIGLVVLAMVAVIGVAVASDATPNFTITNLSKKISVKVRMEVADNDWARMRGLMFREKTVPILFVFGYDGIFPIHSYFVREEFDAVYVSEAGRVNEVFRRVPPNTPLVTPKKNSAYLVELPLDVTDKLKIEPGNRLEWKQIRK